MRDLKSKASLPSIEILLKGILLVKKYLSSKKDGQSPSFALLFSFCFLCLSFLKGRYCKSWLYEILFYYVAHLVNTFCVETREFDLFLSLHSPAIIRDMLFEIGKHVSGMMKF